MNINNRTTAVNPPPSDASALEKKLLETFYSLCTFILFTSSYFNLYLNYWKHVYMEFKKYVFTST